MARATGPRNGADPKRVVDSLDVRNGDRARVEQRLPARAILVEHRDNLRETENVSLLSRLVGGGASL